jgi:hypothetical protein
MSKQTAVEWLVEQMIQYGLVSKGTDSNNVLFHQAKAMEHEQMLELISFVRVHNKMGKTAEDLLQQFEAYKGGEQC